jgi:hypothetical protein
MDLQRLAGDFGVTGTWLVVFVENTKKGTGPIEGVTVKNVRARSLGKYHGKLAGHDEESYLDGVSTVYRMFIFWPIRQRQRRWRNWTSSGRSS